MPYKFKRIHRTKDQPSLYIKKEIEEHPPPTRIEGGFYSYRGFLLIQALKLQELGWKISCPPSDWIVIKQDKFNSEKRPSRLTIRPSLESCVVFVTQKIGVHDGVKRIENPILKPLRGKPLGRRVKRSADSLLDSDITDL